jgi:hypothetical protein
MRLKFLVPRFVDFAACRKMNFVNASIPAIINMLLGNDRRGTH